LLSLHLEAGAQAAFVQNKAALFMDSAKGCLLSRPLSSVPTVWLPNTDTLKANDWKKFSDPESNQDQSFLPQDPHKSFWISTRQVVTAYGLFLTILFISPTKYTKWDHGFGTELLLNAGNRIRSAYTSPPVWDEDRFFTNYITHPYAGSFYYNTMRTKGHSAAASFCFSVFSSTLWEYLPEACFEQPSIQDLIVTPIVGSILGEAVHRLTLEMSIGGFSLHEKVAVLLLNPSYVINHGFKTPSEERRKQMRKMSY